MFLQSQKKKSNIKYKTSEKPKKKKPKSKPKPKPKKDPNNQPEPEPQPEIQENPIPSEIRPIINAPPKQKPEMPIEVVSQPVQPEPFDNSSDVERNLRFNNRQNAKFGIEDEESEGPDLFVQVDNTTEQASHFPNKTSDFVSMGKRNRAGHPGSTGQTTNKTGTPFDSDGIFGEFDLSKKKTQKEYRAHNSHYRNVPARSDGQRKVISEMKPTTSGRPKKKKLVNIFENPNEEDAPVNSERMFIESKSGLTPANTEHLKPTTNQLETEPIESVNLQSDEGKAMINKDGTLNFHYFSKRSQMKQSTYQKDPKLENLLTNQNIVESETRKEGLNFYYGKRSQRSEKSIRGTVTVDARNTHAGSGNIVGKFMKEGNAHLLLEGRNKSRLQEREVQSRGFPGSIRKEDSNGFGFARRKEELSLMKQSVNSKSKRDQTCPTRPECARQNKISRSCGATADWTR